MIKWLVLFQLLNFNAAEYEKGKTFNGRKVFMKNTDIREIRNEICYTNTFKQTNCVCEVVVDGGSHFSTGEIITFDISCDRLVKELNK